MNPRSPIYDLLQLHDTWQPVASLAQDTGIDYDTACRSIKRWEAAGLVETRVVELHPATVGQGYHRRLEARIVR